MKSIRKETEKRSEPPIFGGTNENIKEKKMKEKRRGPHQRKIDR
jgi:hypothetical protein